MYLDQSNYVDVRMYGAKLDGSDDTDAFLTAVDVADKGCGNVFIPPVDASHYNSGGLFISPVELACRRVTIFGINSGGFNSGLESKTSCIKALPGSSGDLITVTGGAGITGQNMTLRGLKLDGNKAACTGTGHGIYLPTVAGGEDSFIEIDHVFLTDFNGDCINSEYGRRATKIVDSKLWNSRNGWNCASSDGWLDKCDIGLMSLDGISVHDWTVSITANNIFSCRNGINLFSGEAALTVVIGNRIDRHQYSGIRCNGRSATLIGNVFHRNSESGQAAAPHIDVLNDGHTVVGNTFKDGAGQGHLASYDIYLQANTTAVVSGNSTLGRGSTSVYGHIGRGVGSRVVQSAGDFAQSPRQYVRTVFDTAAATSNTILADKLLYEIIVRTGIASSGITDVTDTAANIISSLV